MALNLPFKVPLPRRFIILGLSASILFLFLHTFAPTALPPAFTPNLPHAEPDASYFSPSKWLPPIFNPNVPDRPPEFDEDGQCLFLSPYDALSPLEKRRAEYLELEEVSAGVFRAKPLPMTGDDDPDYDDEFSEASNATRTMPAGMTHPIIGLLKEGEKRWKDKLAGQSTTLDQAAQKYLDKWGRPPPKGFDLWWKFARSHKVLLPDEFDSIMRSFSPFYGLPVSTLQERLTEVEKIEETFTLVVHDGKIELQWNDDYARDVWIASRSRADKQINLMEPFIALLPSFRATFTIHDQPTILLDHARQQELLTAAKQGTVSTHPNENDRFEQNWHAACAPTDPINQDGYEELPATDSFILQHTRAMDICQHPSYLHNHGMLLEEKNADTHPKPHTKLYPIFVPSTTMLNSDIPVTPVGSDGHQDHVGSDPIWSRKSGKLYWRGLATGLNHNKREGKEWRKSHRERLHFLANDRKRLNQELLAPVGVTGEAELARYPLKELGEYYMDVKLSGGHWQCDWDDGTCQEMDDEIEFAGQDSAERSNEFKYVFDTDGNAWSSRFPRLMASNNVVIKASVFPEWNTQSLPEWYAYVPSKMDYSDLYSILAFFRGTPSGKGGHDEVARRIALNSQCWVERTWRREDMQVYMFLLYLEYARLASPDRDTGKMDFAMKGRPASAAAPVPPPVSEPEVGVGAAPVGDITPPGTFEEILDDPAPLPLAAGLVPAPVGGGAAGAMAPGAGVLPPQLEDGLLE